ncbi:hypothetical protein [Streptomyces sp. NPDC002588]|uniref:hypothetical protein n=1 Tax=Streptomyces sp. NPDC002588 TaxID=3154419 RepID=UPI00332DE18A
MTDSGRRPLAVFDRDREVRVLVDDDALVCVDAERAGFAVVLARRTEPSAELRAAQEREGRT